MAKTKGFFNGSGPNVGEIKGEIEIKGSGLGGNGDGQPSLKNLLGSGKNGIFTEGKDNKLSLDKAKLIASIKNAAGDIASASGDVASGIIQFKMKMNRFNAELDKMESELTAIENKYKNESQKINLETAYSNQLAHMETFMKETLNLTSATFKMIADGANKGAYTAYKANLDYELSKNKLEKQIELNKTKQSIELLKLGKNTELERITKEKEISLKDAEKIRAEQQVATGLTKAAGGMAKEVPMVGVSLVGGLVEGAGKTADALSEQHLRNLENDWMVEKAERRMNLDNLTGQIDNYSVVVQKQYEMEVKKLEYETMLKEKYAEQAQEIEGWIMEFNKHATNFVRQYGLIGSQLSSAKYANTTGGVTAWSNAAKMNVDDVASSQLAYQTNSGRNLRLSKLDIFEMSFLDKFSGDNGFTGRISAELQPFNKSIADSTTMIAKRMASLERSGLSGRKYAKDIEKYIGLANKYNFKNGAEGLAKMTEWAQKTKFNMDSLSGALDKFSSSDISSVLESSAKLNVLGGNAALYSDPLGMMYDATMDPQSFAKRMQASFSEYGTFNKETGEMEYDYIASQIMKTGAEIYGMNVEDIRKQNNEAEKRRQITGQMSGKNFSDESLDFLIANAFWDKEMGTWAATVGNEKIGVSDLNEGQLNGIMPVTTEDQIEDITKNIRGIARVLNPFLSYEEQDNFNTQAGHLKISASMLELFNGEFKERLKNYNEAVDKLLDNEEKRKELENAMQGASSAILKIFDLANESTYQEKVEDHLSNIQEDVALLTKDIKDEMEQEKKANAAANPATLTKERDEMTAAGIASYEVSTYKDSNGKTHTIRIPKYDFSSAAKDAAYEAKQRLNNGYEYHTFDFTNIPALSDTTSTDTKSTGSKKTKDAFTFGSMYSETANVVTSANDVNMAWQKGGPLDTLFNGVAGKVNVIGDFVEKTSNVGKTGSTTEQKSMNVNVTFGGKAELACNGNQINLASLITNDAFAMRKITEMVLTEISKYNDGRGAVNAYTNVGNIFS